jgi:hypothetical protein
VREEGMDEAVLRAVKVRRSPCDHESMHAHGVAD